MPRKVNIYEITTSSKPKHVYALRYMNTILYLCELKYFCTHGITKM